MQSTVAAIGVLTDQSRKNAARPILLSGTCKRETGEQHAKLIRTVETACRELREHLPGPLYCVASDGESRRGDALERLYYKRLMTASSPCYDQLHKLKLFNLMVGDDDVTLDKDYKHVFKRLRNLILRGSGVLIDGARITPALIRLHLAQTGIPGDKIDAWLNPDDKQDVLTMYALLQALWLLPDAEPDARPAFATSRAALKVFGRMCFYIIAPYVQTSLTLAEQLEYLSAAAHMAIALFTRNDARTDFMQARLFLDLMHMVKNAYICVAKLKVHDPNGSFWLILLGTDRLETAFGILRTIVGNDANADQLQLETRMSHVVQCANIFAEHPEWDRDPRRLRTPAMDERGQISKDADHINPSSWKGDCSVKTVVLRTCWQLGRLRVEKEFASRSFAAQLRTVETTTGADMLSPFGTPIDPKEGDDDDEAVSVPERPARIAPDIDAEDLVGAQDTAPRSSVVPTLLLENGKRVYKARILREMIRQRHKNSTDRLRRVANLSPYTSSAPQSNRIDDDTIIGSNTVCVGDPIATLVSCEKRIVLCVGQIIDLRLDHRSVQSMGSDNLNEDSASVQFQILQLLETQDEAAEDEWHWNRQCERGQCCTKGRGVEPINPAILIQTDGLTSFTFKSEELRSLAITLYDRLSVSDLAMIPVVKRTDRFPYRSNGAGYNMRPPSTNK